MLLRWTRKTVIVALAALGTYRLFELARRRVDGARVRVTPHLHDATERARDAVDDVVSDMNDARQVLKDATQDVSADLVDAANEMRTDNVEHDVTSVAVQPDSSFGTERTGTV